MTALSGRQFAISSGDHRAVITEVGAGLRTYTYGGIDVTCHYEEDELPPKGCGGTLVPWPNRIRDGRYTFDGVLQQLALTEPEAGNAIHGLARWARWDLLEHADDHVRLAIDIVPQKGYPFQLHAEMLFTFARANGLTVQMSARNDGASRAPFGAGCHPYLSTGGTPLDQVRLSVPAEQTLDVDRQQIPIDRRPVGDDEDFGSFPLLGDRRPDRTYTDLARDDDGRFRARLSGDDVGAEIWFDQGFRFVQVYALDDITPGQHGVAIEPMTCAPDAFNSGAGLIVLEPDATWTGTWGITPHR